MLRTEQQRIDLMLGEDGSWAIEGIPGGRHGAEDLLKQLLGDMPADGTYETDVMWDWIYFPSGSLKDPLRSRLHSLQTSDPRGPIVYKVHDAPHVERPGAFVEAYAPMHAADGSKATRVAVSLIVVVLLAVMAFFFMRGRTPGFVEGSFDDVVRSATAAPEPTGFTDRLALEFTDGRHFTVPLTRSSVLHKGPNAAIFAEGSQAYLVESPSIGSLLNAVMESGINEVRFDTSFRAGDVRMVSLDGQLRPARFAAFAVATPQALTGNSDVRIRFDDPRSFAAGVRYAFDGGIVADGDRWLLTHLPLENPPYQVELRASDPGLGELLAYVAKSRFRATVTATLAEVRTKADGNDRVIGATADDLVVTFSNRSYTSPTR
jgi:hypothetical protein